MGSGVGLPLGVGVQWGSELGYAEKPTEVSGVELDRDPEILRKALGESERAVFEHATRKTALTRLRQRGVRHENVALLRGRCSGSGESRSPASSVRLNLSGGATYANNHGG